MNALQDALARIEFARKNTFRLLEHVPTEQWFIIPAGNVSHVGWQVGHLAMAQYRLVLDRIRGTRQEDEALISSSFMQHFGKGSTPVGGEKNNPSREEILAVFNRVHVQALKETASLKEEELSQPPLKPHPLFDTKLGSLFWCERHELMHAGQIGLIRRCLGHEPVW